MDTLPSDVLEIILNKLDVHSYVNLNATCKPFRDMFPLSSKLSKRPIQYLNKADVKSCCYTNLNQMVDDVVSEVCDVALKPLFKEYTTLRFRQYYSLQIHRNVRSKGQTNYSFLLKKGKTCVFQFIYDPAQECYIGIRNVYTESIPLLFIFLGCKVLFRIHGYCDVKSFQKLPDWFVKILLCKTFNGCLFKDIVNGFCSL